MGNRETSRSTGEAPFTASPETATIVNAIRRIVRVLRVAARRAESELGVSGAQLFVLQQLAESPAQSLNDLAARTLTDQSSVSVVVSRLVERGLVNRKPAPNDGRRLMLSVTPAGRAMLRRAPEASQPRILQGLERMGARDRKQLAVLLEKLVMEIGASEEPAEMMFEDEWRPRGRRSSGETAAMSAGGGADEPAVPPARGRSRRASAVD